MIRTFLAILTFVGMIVTVAIVSVLLGTATRVHVVVKRVPVQIALVKIIHVVVPPPQPTVYRHVSNGRYSLATVAAWRHVSITQLETTTLSGVTLSQPNANAFEAYITGGVTKKMPKGLVYYTGVGPAEG